jgi:L-alanine-DL-glutamate epimerase-like enolase superfamily enzyme
MSKRTDVRCVGVRLYFLPVKNRIPLKFGPEITTEGTVARVCMRIADSAGRSAEGWGETPLAATWVWPGSLSYEYRDAVLRGFCRELAAAWEQPADFGHPMEVGAEFQGRVLPETLERFNRAREGEEALPWLGALVCTSAFDLALHDAFGRLHEVPVYETYNGEFMTRDLSGFLEAEPDAGIDFRGQYPESFLRRPVPARIPAWHLVGGTDLLSEEERTGSEPDDGYPVVLPEWIRRDGLTCLKVKLRGNDAAWDYDRLVRVGRTGRELGVIWLTADFNCTVHEPGYVNGILDRLLHEEPLIHQMLLYVEQPFAYDLESNRIDVHSVSARKPLFMDESAHDWRLVRLGRRLGWNGVALKTCKTQTGALLSLCWARAHGMTLMVQDLTNPMLAQVSHVLLAAHAGTIMGVETNSMQFYPEASLPEAAVHPGLYRRRNGTVNLSTVRGAGFGYRLEEMDRTLPEPAYRGW